MIFNLDESKKKKCSCGYIALHPFPTNCPKCGKIFSDMQTASSSPPLKKNASTFVLENSDSILNKPKSSIKIEEKHSKDGQKGDKTSPIKDPSGKASIALTKALVQNNSNVIVGTLPQEQKAREIKQMEVSKSTLTDSDDRIKVKSIKNISINFSDPIIALGQYGEYLKFMGIISLDRLEIYSSNPRFKYLLELGSNVDYIATSVLKGELDRMQMSAPEGGNVEMVFFLRQSGFLFLVYGNFLDKKAAWLLNQMKNNLIELTKGINLNKTEKIVLYNLSQSFQKKALFFLEEYIKLQDVFTLKKLESLDNYFRIDYFGLSYQSIGIMSKLITNILEVGELPPISPDDPNPEETREEYKESMITAKVEALAANTMANTSVMPNWISVKLGFQHYRFLVFCKIQEYFVSLLTEGNLDQFPPIQAELIEVLFDITKNPFVGDLAPFKNVEHQIVSRLKEIQKDLINQKP